MGRARRLFGCGLISAFLVMSSCGNEAQTGTDEKYDSLFLGFRLGMPRQAFYDTCWAYNRRKVFTHSTTNREVEYRLPDLLNAPVSMRFYPTFHEDKIYQMPIMISYEAWAPWNRRFKSDSLIKRLVPVYEKWYGEFQVVQHPQMGTVYYRMDGKRRINIYIKDDQFVRVLFTDMKLEKVLEKPASDG
jgi:hypothetical protein